MSVLMRGVNMPKNCEECNFKGECRDYWEKIREAYTRPSWCPLVEVADDLQDWKDRMWAEAVKAMPQTYITEDRTQMLDRWQVYHRNTTSAVTPCSNCQEFDCYGCEYKQTERSEP